MQRMDEPEYEIFDADEIEARRTFQRTAEPRVRRVVLDADDADDADDDTSGSGNFDGRNDGGYDDDYVEVVRVRTTNGEPQDYGRVDGGRDTKMVPEGAEDRVRRLRLPAFVSKFVSGAILDTTAVMENYRYVVCIMALLLLSIAMLFTSLGVYMRYTKLVEEVQLLRERAIRMSEQRYEQSSHSAVVRSLRARGINLQDPRTPHEIIE